MTDDLDIPDYLLVRNRTKLTEEQMAKIGAREQQLRDMRKVGRAVPGRLPVVLTDPKPFGLGIKKAELDQALAAAQGRGLDAAMLGNNWPYPAKQHQETDVTLNELATEIENPKATPAKSKAAPKAEKSKLKAGTAKTRREPGAKPKAKADAAKPKKPDLKKTTKGNGGKPRADYDAIFKKLQKGATHKQICEFTGWPRGLNRMALIAERNGCKLVQDDGGVYRAVPKK